MQLILEHLSILSKIQSKTNLNCCQTPHTWKRYYFFTIFSALLEVKSRSMQEKGRKVGRRKDVEGGFGMLVQISYTCTPESPWEQWRHGDHNEMIYRYYIILVREMYPNGGNVETSAKFLSASAEIRKCFVCRSGRGSATPWTIAAILAILAYLQSTLKYTNQIVIAHVLNKQNTIWEGQCVSLFIWCFF